MNKRGIHRCYVLENFEQRRLLTGVGEVVVDKSFQTSQGSANRTIQIDQAVGGGDQTKISTNEFLGTR